MPAKTILTILFLISLGVAVTVFLHALPQPLSAGPVIANNEVLVVTTTLPAGTLLRVKDVPWQPITKTEPGQILRPSNPVNSRGAAAEEQALGDLYGAVLRVSVAAGSPFGERRLSNLATVISSGSCSRLQRGRSRSR